MKSRNWETGQFVGEKTEWLKLCEIEVNKWLRFKQLFCFWLKESGITKKGRQ